VDRVIKPALEQKKWVLSDRFDASSVAFQGGGRAISRAQIDWLNAFAIAARRLISTFCWTSR